MNLCRFYEVLIFLTGLLWPAWSFELLTTASLVGLGSILYQNTVCKFSECCTEKEVPANFTSKLNTHICLICSHLFVLELEELLSERLYGQHLVQDIVVNALKSHWYDKQKQKPLTLSFHGWPGEVKTT